jgi:hypothetical protein
VTQPPLPPRGPYPPPGQYPPPMQQPGPPGPPGAAPAPPGGWGYGYGPAYGPGYAAPGRPPVKHTSHTKLIAVFVVGLLVIVGGFLLISKAATPANKATKCPPTCPQPPVGDPVVAMPRFTAPDGSFSVGYPKPSKIFGAAEMQTSGVLVPINAGDGGAILMQGGGAKGQTPEQVVTAFIRAKFPDARQAYIVPNALVGYQSGYGVVDDVYPQSTDGTYVHDRVVVLAAVKNDTSVLVAGIGPFHEFAPDGLTNGHPSGADLLVALVMDPLVNDVEWKGDPKR